MLPEAVKVPVTASVPIECVFWAEDDGWTSSCTQLAITIHGNNFKEAKTKMEEALGIAIESILQSLSGANAAA